MYILGISCWYHDSAAVLIRDGKIIAASEEERFSRKKHDFDFPVRAIEYCMKKAGIGAGEIAYAVFYDKPFIKFERILSSILMNVPRSSGVFREAVPLWLKEKINFRKKIYKELGIGDERVLFCTHHKAHAASCFYVSPFDKADILTVDGVGEWATASLGIGEENSIRILKEMRFPHSVGLLYSAFTAFLGFRVNNGEYKVMGMAPYGRPVYKDKVLEVVKISDDGSIELNMRYFSFAYSTSRTYNKKFERLFGKPRDPGSLFFTEGTGFPAYYGDKPEDFAKQAQENQHYADIAASIQDVVEEILIKMCRHLKDITGLSHLCYAGGVALNSKANYRIVKESGFDDIYIQPASTDAGGALGAALWCWHEILGNRKAQVMEHAYFGKLFSDEDIEAALADVSLGYEKLEDDILFDRVAGSVSDGKVVGWYQGPTEWGPRALGNRSIIGDPRDAGMKDKINAMIKFREPYRPFAPSIMSEDVDEYIERKTEIFPDRFMLVTYPVRNNKKQVIPAVTHVNGTARIQSVKKEISTRYWRLIRKFKEKTGVGVVLNTSFNLKGEPIVNSPADAIKTFKSSGLDYLVLGNYLVKKEM